jgi:hypothetical protein
MPADEGRCQVALSARGGGLCFLIQRVEKPEQAMVMPAECGFLFKPGKRRKLTSALNISAGTFVANSLDANGPALRATLATSATSAREKPS